MPSIKCLLMRISAKEIHSHQLIMSYFNENTLIPKFYSNNFFFPGVIYPFHQDNLNDLNWLRNLKRPLKINSLVFRPMRIWFNIVHCLFLSLNESNKMLIVRLLIPQRKIPDLGPHFSYSSQYNAWLNNEHNCKQCNDSDLTIAIANGHRI